MAILFDEAGDHGERVYLAATLPDPAATGLTILGWWRIHDAVSFETYYRTSTTGGASTIHTVGTSSGVVDVNLFSIAGDINSGVTVAEDEWVGIAVVDTGSGVTLYVRPLGGSTTATPGTPSSGTPAHFCVGGRDASNINETLLGNAAYVRVFADALSQAEVEAEWASETAVVAAWADYPLVDDIQDASGNGRHLTAVLAAPTFEAGPDLGGDEVVPSPFWSRVRVANPRLVRGRSRVTSGRITRAGYRRPA